MSDEKRLASEKLVEVHRARDEWQGNLIVGYLRGNGVVATIQAQIQRAKAAVAAGFADPDNSCGVFVLEHESWRARNLVQEFLAAVTDEKTLEEEAGRKLRVDKETITRLRSELREERRTFNLLGWLFVAFLSASALLWAIWPEWLKTAPPESSIRWVMVIMLALAAVFAGNWANKQMR